MKNINPTHADTLQKLQLEIAELVIEKERRQTQLECLEIAAAELEKNRNWIRFAEYSKAIGAYNIDIVDREAYISMQSDEYRRLKAAAENENIIETYLLNNPQLHLHNA